MCKPRPAQAIRHICYGIGLLLCSGFCYAQEVTLYIIPPPAPVSWNSPRSLLLSYLKNRVVSDRSGNLKHSVGHVVVELKDAEHYAMIGMVPLSKKAMDREVRKGKYGMASFFTGFAGKMEEADVNLPQVKDRLRTGDISYLRFKVNKENFSRLWTYLQEYKTRGYDRIYNGNNRPRHGEGAGCTAFAMSFLEVAGLPVDDITRQWTVSVAIPESLIGGPLGRHQQVRIIDMLIRGQWADKKQEAYHDGSYVDPQLMHRWVLEQHNTATTIGKPERWGAANGVLFDFTAWPAPTTAMFFSPPYHDTSGSANAIWVGYEDPSRKASSFKRTSH